MGLPAGFARGLQGRRVRFRAAVAIWPHLRPVLRGGGACLRCPPGERVGAPTPLIQVDVSAALGPMLKGRRQDVPGAPAWLNGGLLSRPGNLLTCEHLALSPQILSRPKLDSLTAEPSL